MIYLDHNSTTNILDSARESLIAALNDPLNPSAVHGLGRTGKSIMEKSRRQVASLVGANGEARDYNVIFTSSGTEANNLIIHNFNSDDAEIFISATEHASILARVKYQSNIKVVAVDRQGLLDMEHLRFLLAESKAPKKLVSVIFAHNETGVIQNIGQIVQIARNYGASIHSDVVQAVGRIPVEMKELDLDFATVSGHKIGGGVGGAALICKGSYHILPHIIGGGQERGARSGTENTAAIAAFGAAASAAKSEQHSRFIKLQNLLEYLENCLAKNFPQVQIVGKEVNRLPNTCMLIVPGKKAETQLIAFDLHKIALSSGSACSSGKIGSSEALKAMGYSDEDRQSAIRISLGVSNSKEDIDKFLSVFAQINS